MQIDYTADLLDDDFPVKSGISFTVENGCLRLMAFLIIASGLIIDGLSVEQRSDEIHIAVIAKPRIDLAPQHDQLAPNKQTHRLTATIRPIADNWHGNIVMVVRHPHLS